MKVITEQYQKDKNNDGLVIRKPKINQNRNFKSALKSIIKQQLEMDVDIGAA